MRRPALDASVGQRALQAEGVSLERWVFANAVALSGDGRVVIGRGYCGELEAMYRAVLPD
jgi:hypothetical protein